MERLGQPRRTGISSNALYYWGLIFLIAGTVSRGLIQNSMLHLGRITPSALLEAMQSDAVMSYVTAALVLQALETCAVPIFAYLLVEGVQHTSDLPRYMLRVLGLAVLTEIPFNLATSGQIFELSSRNPVVGLALGIIMLFFYCRYPEKGFKQGFIRVLVTIGAIGWCAMLRVEYGVSLVLITAVLWAFRKKQMLGNFIAASVSLLCSLSSLLYIAAPMGFLIIHFCNGEREESSRALRYLLYPLILLAVFVIGLLL